MLNRVTGGFSPATEVAEMERDGAGVLADGEIGETSYRRLLDFFDALEIEKARNTTLKYIAALDGLREIALSGMFKHFGIPGFDVNVRLRPSI
jgi:hypothetical protein